MIGILLITHGTLGESLIHTAIHVLNKRPPSVRQLGVTAQDDPALLLPQAPRATTTAVAAATIQFSRRMSRLSFGPGPDSRLAARPGRITRC